MTSHAEGAGGGFPTARDEGFSLVEVLVALMILVVVAVAAVALVVNLIRTSRATALRIAATNVAQQDVQTMRAVNLTPAAPTSIISATTSTTVGSTMFSVARTVQVCIAPSQFSSVYSCVASGSTCPPGGYRTVTTAVSWPTAVHPVELRTRLAC